jgi:hypothetical protein
MDSEAIASVKHAYIVTTSASGHRALGMCTAEGANVTNSIATITASSTISATSESTVPLAEVCIVPGSDTFAMSDVFKVTSGSGTLNWVEDICAPNVSASSADVQSMRAIVIDKTELVPRTYVHASMINSSSSAPHLFSYRGAIPEVEDSFRYAAAEHSRLSRLAPWEIGEIDSTNIMPQRDNTRAVNEERHGIAFDLIASIAFDDLKTRASVARDTFDQGSQQDANVVSDEMSRAQRLSLGFAWCDDFKLFAPKGEGEVDVEGDSNTEGTAKHREGPSSMESFDSFPATSR